MSWIDAGKLAWEAIEDLKDAKAKKAVADALLEGAKIAGENAELRARVRELEEQARLRAELVFEGNAYWLPRDGGREGPFCSKCFDVDGKVIRLHHWEESRQHACPSCHTIVREPGRERAARPFPGPQDPGRWE